MLCSLVVDSETWWQPLELEHGARFEASVGKSSLVVEHDADEWRVSTSSSSGPDDPAAIRVATSAAALQLHPRLAPRPVVARLEVPVHIGAGEQVAVYVGSPLWIEVQLAPPSGAMVGELSFYTPPNTWFGPSTREGELCFASRTSGRLRRDRVEHHADRAITPVAVENQSDAPLVFERVRIRTPSLSLYRAEDGTLWTNRVRIRAESAEDAPRVTIDDGPPSGLDVGKLVELASPRRVFQPKLLARAFGALL